MADNESSDETGLEAVLPVGGHPRGGFMSAGIAESGSLARLPVLIRELPEYIAAARTRLEKFMGSAVKRGKLDADERDGHWPASPSPAS